MAGNDAKVNLLTFAMIIHIINCFLEIDNQIQAETQRRSKLGDDDLAKIIQERSLKWNLSFRSFMINYGEKFRRS